MRLSVRGALVLAVGLCGGLVAWQVAEPSTGPERSPSSSGIAQRGPCGADLSTKPRLDGPLEDGTVNVLTFDMNEHYRAADVGLVSLHVPEGKSVVVDSVQLEPDKNLAPVELVRTFVVDNGSQNLTLRPVGKYPAPLEPMHCFEVEHAFDNIEPFLVLRLRATPGKHSRNRSIDVVYHTPDGQRYVAIHMLQIDFPNKPWPAGR